MKSFVNFSKIFEERYRTTVEYLDSVLKLS